MQHLHLRVFTHKELIWTVDFRFGVQKVETIYIPSNQVQDFIDEKEQCNDANYKFTCQQLRRNEIRKLLYLHWDNYFKFSRF
jgi:hypothetical protein